MIHSQSVFAHDVELPRALVAPPDFRPLGWDWLNRTIPAIFAEQVAKYPQRIAVQSDDAQLTYAELNRQANRLAHCVLAWGGPAPEPVALWLNHDINLVVAVMAILKAGKFFVPVKSNASPAEIQAILEDAGARLLVTDAPRNSWTTALPERERLDLQIIELDALADDLPVHDPDIPMTAATYAHIAYTSGSTGVPKGILRTHAVMLYSSFVHINGYFITPDDRLMASTPLFMGASMVTVLSALLTGATILPINLRGRSPAAVSEWLRTERITAYQSVASFFRQFAAALRDDERFPELRIIKLGGETIQLKDIELYKQHFADHCILRIGLASSEAGTYCWHFVGKETVVDGPNAPVGRPLAGTSILLLDENGEEVASGEVGEIAVRSAYLPVGYWRKPELTRAKFLPDPEGGPEFTCMTGDLGRWRDDNLLEHVGRSDQMVKIRGNRVEIGAVEAALLALPGVKEAAVVVTDDPQSAKGLIAYLVPIDEKRNVYELRTQLRARLADYMIPARFVWLDAMPRLAGDKIDRRALPRDAGRQRPDLSVPFVPPRTELEFRLAAIWADLLKLDEIGVNDDFFDLGGDSLLALEMLLAVDTQFGYRIPIEFFGDAQFSYLRDLIADARETKSTLGPQSISESAISESAVSERVTAGRFTAKSSAPRTRQTKPLTPDYIFQHLIRNGPLWGGRRLPYRIGVQMQRLWVRLPLVRPRLQARAAVFRDWLSFVGHTDPDGRALDLSLLTNTWRRWREICLEEPAVYDRWVTLRGIEHLDAAQSAKLPIILVGTHTAIRRAGLSMTIRRRWGQPAWTLGYSPDSAKDAVAKVLHAKNLLAQGGMVMVTGDGAQGVRGVEASLAGRTWRFRSGGAELALDTGAILLPVFNTLAHNGEITVEFLPPLTSNLPAREQKIEELTGQYAALLAARWPRLLDNMKWEKLQQIKDYAECNGAP